MSNARLFFGISLMALLTAALAHAQNKDPTTYVQMAGITAAAGSASGQRGTVPVTVVLHVANSSAAGEICRRIPAVRAAIMATSSRSPIPFAKGTFDSDAVSQMFANEINTAIALKAVLRASFIHGTPKHVADTATDVVDPGDVTGQKQTMKSGAGQTSPCRRIAAPPADLGWTVVAEAPDPRVKAMAPRAPPLRDAAKQPPPAAPAFETHPQFAPRK